METKKPEMKAPGIGEPGYVPVRERPDWPKCTGCGEPMDSPSYDVCFQCVKARHRAVVMRKCCCGNKRRPTEVKRMASRTWISCHRCLGQIKQLT
jgi:hypothetical protein